MKEQTLRFAYENLENVSAPSFGAGHGKAPVPSDDLEVRFRYHGNLHAVVAPSKAARPYVEAIVDVLRALEQNFENVEDAIKWVNETVLPGYAGKTARDLIEQGRGQSVLNYIDAFRRGAHA
ncbi:MAG: hypothetical protein AAFY65_18980 [Pseudomonadota bacterium]